MRAHTALLGTLALLGGLLLSAATAQAQTTWYVDCAASGAGTGLNWTDAFTNLQDALGAATSGDEIWVAACSVPPGAYRPDQGTGHTPGLRDETFSLVNGVAVYGGFPPGGGAWPDRDPTTNQTILSGDLAGDDGSYSDCCTAGAGSPGCTDPVCESLVCGQDSDCCTVAWDAHCAALAHALCGACESNKSDNAYHVVLSDGNNASAILDGFTITGGFADDAAPPRNSGAGLYITGGNPSINTLDITNNIAAGAGAGVYVIDGSPALTDLYLYDNAAGTTASGSADGGGMYVADSAAHTLLGCTFADNIALRSGAGMYVTGTSAPDLTNCGFDGNAAEAHGGGMYIADGSTPVLGTVTFDANTAEANGGGIYSAGGSDPQITNGLFENNEATDGGAMYLTQSSPVLQQTDFSSNTAASDGGALFCGTGSAPVLTDCTFDDNYCESRGGAVSVFFGNPQLTACSFTVNQAGGTLGRGGAMYCDNASPTLSRCTFTINTAAQDGGAMYNINTSVPLLTGCLFSNNTTPGSGGALYNRAGSDAEVHNCLFFLNAAVLNGGAVYNRDCRPRFSSCTISRNDADGVGGGIANTDYAKPTLGNCILWANTDGTTDVSGAQITPSEEAPQITYSCIQDADPDDGTVFTGTGNIDDDPMFVNPTGNDFELDGNDPPDTVPGTSPCIDAGFNALVHPTVTADLAGRYRFINHPDVADTGAGTSPIVDMGAYEHAADCNTNAIDDVCELDCGEAGGPCDVAGCGTLADCNFNDKPDTCEPDVDCNGNSVQDICDIAGGTSSDCNDNQVPDECDIASGTSGDCSGNGIPDECEPDCQPNGIADRCDIYYVSSQDCNANDIPDECDIAAGTSADCNTNGVPDNCDISSGTSQDCTSNGIPDECEPDCNTNGVADSCDIDAGTSEDCSPGNGIPDECEPDCNGNLVADSCDVFLGTSVDCNKNEVPDECEPQDDCNNNGSQDICDIANRISEDCNGNEVPDECDTSEGTSTDCDNNDVPDECEPDCNANGVADACDISGVTSTDCNNNDIPDECESDEDCNGNSVSDICDIAGPTSDDCNTNGIPDECEIAAGSSTDCDLNDVPDECQTDCNNNGLADACDLLGGAPDCNLNGILDVCETDGGVLLQTSFESESEWPPGWTVSGYFGATSLWHTTDLCPPGGAPAGTRWAYFGLDESCTFNGGIVAGALSAPSVFIPPTAKRATLTYASAYQGENGDSPDGFDAAWVEINGFYEADDVSLAGDQLDWQTRHVDLSAFIGQIITISFNFHSQDGFNNDGRGWVIDDVLLTYDGTDCQDDGIPDVCQLETDCNFNQVPDECEPDCNNNGVADECDIIFGTSTDCNFNDVPDICDWNLSDTKAADICFQSWYVCPGPNPYLGSTEDATADGSSDCDPEGETSPDVWYRYAPQADGDLTVSLCGSGFDTVLSIHERCPGTTANDLACSDVDVCAPQPGLTVPVQAGGLYLIRVAGKTANDYGSFELTLSGPACRELDCDSEPNGELDVCDILLGVYEDCNENGYPDTCDITAGFEDDCNEDREPDSCTVQFVDCNDNLVPDDCDIDPADPDGDGEVIGDCQPDDIPDDCQLFANDCDGNDVPDECDLDTDGDNTPDACDGCPDDPNKTDPGICGCGTPDDPANIGDDDQDGVPNCLDLCPDTPPDTPVDEDGCPAPGACCVDVVWLCFDGYDQGLCENGGGTFKGHGTFCSDPDGDEVDDLCYDLCPGTPSGVPVDENGCPLDVTGACCVLTGFCLNDKTASECESLSGSVDNWISGLDCDDPTIDPDGDGVPTDCDDCPDDGNKVQPGQCGCGTPDTDSDGDSVADCLDICPGYDDNVDSDGDNVPDGCDICPGFDDNLDADGDNTPDGCDACPNEPALITPSEPGAELTCTDGIDNDCDGATDAADSDCSGAGCPYQCGDIDGSGGGATLSDFATFAACYGFTAPNPPGCTDTDFVCSDLDADGIVSLGDFATFATWYGLSTTLSAPNCITTP